MLLEVLTSTILGLAPLHEAGFRGQGIKVAVIDAGFYAADADSVFDQQRIKAHWDLLPTEVRQAELFSNPADYHGTACLSTMLRVDSTFVGTAPEADYYLIRTEDIYHENLAEVDRLTQALRMADSLGADVISISLGYSLMDDTTTSFTYAQLDGQLPVSQAATEVARHGRIVCVAAGNDGQKPWHHIAAPADAEDILTVGACNEAGTDMAAFSSWGPAADGRQKPEVSAWGQSTRVYLNGRMQYGNGTSFATPEIAGMCASLLSALPSIDRAHLRQLIIESGSRYTTPDAHWGYGVPDAWSVYQAALLTKNENENENENENRNGNENRVRKIMRDGQIWIVRGERIYSLLGL